MKNKKRRRFKREGKFYAYIAECKDGTYYAGYTKDIKERIKLHNEGKGAKYTRDRRPVRLVCCKEYKYFKLAFLEEKRIKALTRGQKEKLVSGKISRQKRFYTMSNKINKVTPNSKRSKNLSLKSSSTFFEQSSAWQPKVFIKTFGWPLVPVPQDYPTFS